MVGYSYQNYVGLYASFSSAYACLHNLRMSFGTLADNQDKTFFTPRS